MTQTIDQEGLASLASAKAQNALARGDTPEAQELSAEAASIFEAEMRCAQDEESQHLLRFLASTQYYRGGHYQEAARLAEQISPTKLPANTRHLLPAFLRDVKDRFAPDYVTRIRGKLGELSEEKSFEAMLALLAEHPFVLPPADLAFFRALCCEPLGKLRTAISFFRKAAQYAPNDPKVLARLVDLPIHQAVNGDFQGAWEYVKIQLEVFPNPVSKMLASLLYNHDARRAEGQAQASLWAEQLRLFHEATEEFGRLSEAQRANPRIKELMQKGYRAIALARYSQGKKQEALAICDEAIAAAPDLPAPWILRGILTNEDRAKAVPAFRKAISLGETSFFPYASLAYHAVSDKAFEEALEMATAALERGAAEYGLMRSMLLQLRAISLANLEGPREEVGRLFREALEAAPDNEDAQENYRRFLASETPWRMPNDDAFLRPVITPEWDARPFNPDWGDAHVERNLAAVPG